MSDHTPGRRQTAEWPIWVLLVPTRPSAGDLARQLDFDPAWIQARTPDHPGRPYVTWRTTELARITARVNVPMSGADLAPDVERELLDAAAHAINAVALGLDPDSNSHEAVDRLARLALLTGNDTNPPLDFLHGVAMGEGWAR
ncbi:hypothetical protein [Planotetraspora phitsanulokensis]|uniref:Uncharacterized protein n=1 Tax=Planotetraspora phitsanulokensis TaxID=575192 RepID=A0A8J3UIK2_9ACTN|nr:hypothetical protein [Planotetraspora phitsanulokensis]GII42959.1 hypothetical protein Pph01_79620 [Planotetraspora phitsanulokensis]